MPVSAGRPLLSARAASTSGIDVPAARYALIETSFGCCAVAWGAAGITHFQLPDADRDTTERRLLKRVGGAEPGTLGELGSLAEDVQRYFSGERVDFSGLALDFAGAPEFHRLVYAEVLRLGWGETTTYGAVARKVSNISAARAVGQAMGSNPIPLIMPCHRVLASGDKLGGFSAFGGSVSKERMLALEGVIPGMPLFAWSGG